MTFDTTAPNRLFLQCVPAKCGCRAGNIGGQLGLSDSTHGTANGATIR
jgi:hypothetical protein